MKDELDGAFHNFFKENPPKENPVPDVIPDLLAMETSTPKEKFELLSSISNFHRYGFPNPKTGHREEIVHPQDIVFTQHMFHGEESDMSQDGVVYRKSKIPCSPRLRLMYFIHTEQQVEFVRLLKYLLNNDNGNNPGYVNEHDYDQREMPNKRRKQGARLVSVTVRALAAELAMEDNDLNSANPLRTMYTSFTENLIADGIINWRMHTETKDICVMNDYNRRGIMLPQSYVHVTCTHLDGRERILQCTCAIYDVIKRAAHQGIDILPGEEAVPDETLTCMHCRFYREHLMNGYIRVQADDMPRSAALDMVYQSIPNMTRKVQLLGNVIMQSVTKFSVKGHENYAVLNVSFQHNKCYVLCTNGMCSVGLKNKKNITKRQAEEDRKLRKALEIGADGVEEESYEKVIVQCSHLQRFYNEMDYVESFFPDFFNQTDDDEEIQQNPPPPPEDPVNNDDLNIAQTVNGNFDTVTGLWNFKSLTDHKPKQMMDPILVECTRRRNETCLLQHLQKDTGLYGLILLKPQAYDEQDNPIICNCGQPFIHDDGNYSYKGSGTVYGRTGPIHVNYFNLVCQQGLCEIPFTSSAEKNCMFMLTKKTAMGDEIAWDFYSMVKNTKCSFTAFCNDMTRRYQTNNIFAGPFMSPNTFIQVFFGWMAAHKIDFRKDPWIDPWCKYQPKLLACDGTHIGVSVRQAKITPIEKQELPHQIYDAVHQRNDRVLLADKGARIFLRYLCKKQLREPQQLLTPTMEAEKTREFMAHVEEYAHPDVYQVMWLFVEKRVHRKVLVVLARLLKMMSGDAALSSVIPFMSHNLIEECMEDMEANGHVADAKLTELENFIMEISQLMLVSNDYGCSNEMFAFFRELLDRVKRIHNRNRPPPDVEELAGTYDPRTGIAYYFSESGNQLRKMPVYSVSGKCDTCGKGDNAAMPDIDKCSKYYPRSNLGGFGYIFLWFCPIHGHSYGFHCINGGEGRKDVFSSLYKYLEKQPDHVFYDFACQLHEYCLNREPELFKNTRFWHDLFHSIGHLCGINYKSGRIRGLQGLNTSICEQWNSFLQCIKYTGAHLTQEHFSFLLQFFIAQQNKEKTETYREILTTALAGHL